LADCLHRQTEINRLRLRPGTIVPCHEQTISHFRNDNSLELAQICLAADCPQQVLITGWSDWRAFPPAFTSSTRFGRLDHPLRVGFVSKLEQLQVSLLAVQRPYNKPAVHL